MATNNNFTVTGIVAMDAQVKNNGNGSVWAKFQISALQNIEVSTKQGSPKLDLLKKGTIVKVEGFFEPRTYTGKDEKEHFALSWKATAIEKIEKKEDTPEA